MFFAITLIVMVFCRFPQLVHLFFASNFAGMKQATSSVVAIVRNGGMNVYAYISLLITLERYFASHYSRSYERKGQSLIHASVILTAGALYVSSLPSSVL